MCPVMIVTRVAGSNPVRSPLLAPTPPHHKRIRRAIARVDAHGLPVLDRHRDGIAAKRIADRFPARDVERHEVGALACVQCAHLAIELQRERGVDRRCGARSASRSRPERSRSGCARREARTFETISDSQLPTRILEDPRSGCTTSRLTRPSHEGRGQGASSQQNLEIPRKARDAAIGLWGRPQRPGCCETTSTVRANVRLCASLDQRL